MHTRLDRHGLRILAFVVVTMAYGTSCERPIRVEASIAGAQTVALRGTLGRTGTTLRELLFERIAVPKGTRVQISDTWLIRREKADPPSYVIAGAYDPADRADGFVLPASAVDVYYLGWIEPERRVRIPVPAAYMAFDPPR